MISLRTAAAPLRANDSRRARPFEWHNPAMPGRKCKLALA